MGVIGCRNAIEFLLAIWVYIAEVSTRNIKKKNRWFISKCTFHMRLKIIKKNNTFVPLNISIGLSDSIYTSPSYMFLYLYYAFKAKMCTRYSKGVRIAFSE